MTPSPDGTLHLPLPAGWGDGAQPVRVKAKIELAGLPAQRAKAGLWKGFGCMKGKLAMAPAFDEPLEDCNEHRG